MSFDCDAFISYSHLDNVGRSEGVDGWITCLNFALKKKLGELLGEKPNVYFDSRLDGNQVFEITLIDTLRKVAVLVAVVSPRYLKSDWTRREFEEFCKAAEAQGGVLIHDKARIFKVLKTPVPRDQELPLMSKLLGYEFYWSDPKTGTPHELDGVYGPSAAANYQMKVDDLAYDISTLLEVLRKEFAAGDRPVVVAVAKPCTVYLAETTTDLKKEREAIRRDLLQHGYTVLPACSLPLTVDELKAQVAADLAKCQMSIHPIGGTYGLVPEGCEKSLIEIQNELAIERDEKDSGFVRLLWIPPGKKFEDARQSALVDQLRTNPRMQSGADLLETYFEDLLTVIYERLKKSAPAAATGVSVAVTVTAQQGPIVQAAATVGTAAATAETTATVPAATNTVAANSTAQGTKAAVSSVVSSGDVGQIYLIHDERDAAGVKAFADYLFDQGFEVLRPLFKGDETEVREAHEENLRVCNGALIFYGVTNEAWVRRKLREIQKSVGYGRTDPLPVTSIVSMPPMTDEKQQFRTHDCTVIAAQSEFNPAGLTPFLTLMKPEGG